MAAAGWDIQRQVREEVSFTQGRVIVRGKLHSRVKSRRADFILYHQPNLPLAVIEAKDNTHSLGDGMQQALDYAEAVAKVEAPYFDDDSGRMPRYYQVNAINRSVEAVARGQNRVLLVMATGTGKTYTAFQIIWRLWKSRQSRRILFLADRNILVDQTKNNDFKPFGAAMTKISKRQIDTSYEIYLSLYQAVTGAEEERNIYK